MYLNDCWTYVIVIVSLFYQIGPYYRQLFVTCIVCLTCVRIFLCRCTRSCLISLNFLLNFIEEIECFSAKHLQNNGLLNDFHIFILFKILWPVLFHNSIQSRCSVVSNSVTPWITASQASLSITNFRSSPKPMSIESVMPFSHLILCHLLLLLPLILLH